MLSDLLTRGMYGTSVNSILRYTIDIAHSVQWTKTPLASGCVAWFYDTFAQGLTTAQHILAIPEVARQRSVARLRPALTASWGL